jgi:hypothetical protein
VIQLAALLAMTAATPPQSGYRQPTSSLTDVASATIVRAFWSNSGDLPKSLKAVAFKPRDLVIELQHQGRGMFYIPMRRFMNEADLRFKLHPSSGPDLRLTAETGTSSTTDDKADRTFVVLRFVGNDKEKLTPGMTYKLVPENHNAEHLWRMTAPIGLIAP